MYKYIKFTLLTALFTVLISSISVMPQQVSAKASLSDVYGSYYKVVANLINEYGVGTEDFTAGGIGLAYAQLIDFDKKGTTELLVIYSDGSNNYILEVWGYINNKASMIYSTSDGNRGLVGDLQVSLLTTQSATYIDYSSQYSSGRGDAPYENQYSDDHTIWALSNNKFSEIVSLWHLLEESPEGNNERDTYTLENKSKKQTITKASYEKLLSQYNIFKGKTIIVSSAGSKSYGFDLQNNKKTIDDFVKKLKSSISATTLAKVTKELKKPTVRIEKAYDSIAAFQEGFAKVEKDGKYGFIDKTGKEVIKPQYDSAEGFSGGLAVISKNRKYGFVDKKGKLVVAAKYDYAFSIREGLASVYGNGGWGFIDKTGKEVIKLQYNDPSSIAVDGFQFSEGLAGVSKNGKWGYIDKKGNVVLKFQYDYAGEFSQGAANVWANGKWYYINKNGSAVKEPAYRSNPTSLLSEGLEAIEKDGYWGYFDKKGKEIIKPQYDSATAFSNGIAVVRKGDRWMLIPNPLTASAK